MFNRIPFQTAHGLACACRATVRPAARILVILGAFLANCASASLVYDSSIHASAQGFGNAPRALTIQHTGPGVPNDFESGCVGVSATGEIIVGPDGCRKTDAAIDPNGVTPVGGDEPNPHADNQKFGIPTLTSLGITNAGQIAILFNATEPGGNSIDVTDITLNFYSPAGVFLTSLDGQQSFPSTNPGNGVAGFVFVVDAAERAALNASIFAMPNFGSTILALNSSLTGATGGPDSFLIFNRGTLGSDNPLPEPATLFLTGLACLLAAAFKRRRSVVVIARRRGEPHI
jgi:hypothetical protein